MYIEDTKHFYLNSKFVTIYICSFIIPYGSYGDVRYWDFILDNMTPITEPLSRHVHIMVNYLSNDIFTWQMTRTWRIVHGRGTWIQRLRYRGSPLVAEPTHCCPDVSAAVYCHRYHHFLHWLWFFYRFVRPRWCQRICQTSVSASTGPKS